MEGTIANFRRCLYFLFRNSSKIACALRDHKIWLWILLFELLTNRVNESLLLNPIEGKGKNINPMN